MHHPPQCRAQVLALGVLFLAGCGENAQNLKQSGPAPQAKEAPSAPSSDPASSPQKAPSVPEGPGFTPRPSPASGFPCPVEKVLAASCRRCHYSPQENDAPFPLVMFEDTQKVRTGKPIFVLMQQMVEADLMPPTDLALTPKVAPLSPDQKATLLTWLKAGAKKDSAPCP